MNREKNGRFASTVKPRTHMVIPDTQCKPGVPLEHLYWAGLYAAEKKPDVIVHLGDHWDMASLSSYETRGAKYFEGKRVIDDVTVGNDGLKLFESGLGTYQPLQKIMLRGNHEYRIIRATNDDPKLEGIIGYHQFNDKELGWDVKEFLEPIMVDGVTYSHYFQSPGNGRPYSGQIETILKNVGFSFIAGHQQGLKIARRELTNGTVHTGIIAGCLVKGHKVLTADLRYVAVENLTIGDKLVSFDEYPDVRRGRRFKTGTLLDTKISTAPVYEVKLESGKVFTVTADHGWLMKRRGGTDYIWKMTSELKIGDKIPKVIEEWETATSYDAGWLSGIYDGEGYLYARQTTGGYACQLGVSQKEGLVLTKIQSTLPEETGVSLTTEHVHNGVMNIRTQGGTRTIAKTLGILRPARLLSKFTPELLGGLTTKCSKDNKRGIDIVVSIMPLGIQEIVQTKVDTGTLIVEGYPHHNSFYQHNEEYRGPQATNEWRGILMLHEVRDGNYDIMTVSLDFLRRKYGS